MSDGNDDDFFESGYEDDDNDVGDDLTSPK